MFILTNITNVIAFDKERAMTHPVAENKHSSEIDDDVPEQQRKNPEFDKLETFPYYLDMPPHAEIKTENLGELYERIIIEPKF